MDDSCCNVQAAINCKLFTKPQRSGGVVITAVYCGFALQLLTQVTGEECVRRSREIGRYGGGLRKKRSRREYLVCKFR